MFLVYAVNYYTKLCVKYFLLSIEGTTIQDTLGYITLFFVKSDEEDISVRSLSSISFLCTSI